MNLKERREGVKWFKQRVAQLVGEGKPGATAVAQAKKEGKAKFGVDWAGIFALLEKLIPLLLKLFA